MKARLLFVNLLLCCLVSGFAQDTISKGRSSESHPSSLEDGRVVTELGEARDYNLFMQIRGRELTALCVMELKADSSIVGTVVNEFGMKAFDFSFVNGKAKVFNVIAFLDKWYIRKVLRGDFSFILSNMGTGHDAVKKKRRLTLQANGDICVSNDRYNIHYTFTPMSSKP